MMINPFQFFFRASVPPWQKKHREWNSLFILILLFIFSVGSVKAQTVPGTARIAYFNRDSLLKIMPEVKAARDSVEKFNEEMEAIIQPTERDYGEREKEYQNEKIDSPFMMAALEKEIADLQNKIQAFLGHTKEMSDNLEYELMKPIYLKIDNAVKNVALKKGYCYVLDSSKGDYTLLYGAPEYNIFNDMCLELGIPVPISK
jgi:outer membrane protein